VVVNDSLVLVNHINTLRKERRGAPMIEIVSDAASDRLRAIVLTTLTTVAGLLPLAYGIGGSDPFIAPMVLAMGFGLLFASPVTLALVPSLYLVMDDAQRLGRRIFRRPAPAPGPEAGASGGGGSEGARVIGLRERRGRDRDRA
jgi:Cu/Ag efflux pump CusA